MYRRACIISEHDGIVDAAKYRFPLRNRIVAALADLIIVIEAPEKSGALLTVDYALEMGKPILAVPGPIFSIHSIGSNRLLDQGATPLCSTRQLDEYLQIHRSQMHRSRSLTHSSSDPGERQKGEERGVFFSRCLSSQSSDILHYIRTRKTADIYEMALSADISITDALEILTELEQEGIVKQVAQGQYIYLL